MKLIVNADDFGYSKGVNHGIVDSFKDGIVTATTLLTTMPGSQHAYELAKEHPTLDIGIHLTIDLGRPTLGAEKVPGLIQGNGEFHTYEHWTSATSVPTDEIYAEWKNQLETAIENGIKPSHIDSHHHLHMLPLVFPIYTQLAHEYGLGVRFHPCWGWTAAETAAAEDSLKELKRADYFSSDFYEEKVAVNFFESLPMIDETWEIMCHPAYLDPELLKRTSYLNERITEVEVLNSDETKAEIERLGIELISFKDL